ncbi:unnamed protein product [Cyprideis torosa]|uniref:Uncharacterized protein n=1 Tax=Cyprideis torosa TaxID=163714 RepID=A0A7R8WJR7_9CRUS|nr:unnamed protein product [Cyprideis torosa]CAG0902368.1 unnamed protein product [Cyprideis torosa]
MNESDDDIQIIVSRETSPIRTVRWKRTPPMNSSRIPGAPTTPRHAGRAARMVKQKRSENDATNRNNIPLITVEDGNSVQSSASIPVAISSTLSVPKWFVVPSTSERPMKRKAPNSNAVGPSASKRTKPSVIAQELRIRKTTVEKVLGLYEAQNTVPFVARYRRDATGNLEPEKLWAIQNRLQELRDVQQRAQKVLTEIEKQGKLTPQLCSAIKKATTEEDVNDLYAPYKPTRGPSMADKARGLGLGAVAKQLMEGTLDFRFDPYQLVDQRKEDLSSLEKVVKQLSYIIAEIIYKDPEVISRSKVWLYRHCPELEIRENKAYQRPWENGGESRSRKELEKAFKEYENARQHFNTALPVNFDRNQPPSHKELKRQRTGASPACEDTFFPACRWEGRKVRWTLLEINSAAHLNVKPTLERFTRTSLNEKAERESIDVFCQNLRPLLLQAPVRGVPILAIDPGFKNGCKLALVSKSGAVVSTDTIRPLFIAVERNDVERVMRDPAAIALRRMIVENKCEKLAIGDGHGCRDTEAFFSLLNRQKFFAPLNPEYVVVREEGASVYSTSPEAKADFPTLDPLYISAVSIARRLQDPLSELVKIDPRNLGVGMYQHDLPPTKLKKALEEVVVECVSAVGLDLNTASEYILQRVRNPSEFDPLDQTMLHPETYSIARK